MEQKSIPWDTATKPELVMFASQVLGMPVMPTIGEDKLRGKIRAAFGGDEITIMVQDGEAEPPAAADAPLPLSDEPADPRALRGTSGAADPVVKITIAEVEGAGGKRAVPVGINGVMMLVPRGRPVDIPYRYYEALSHAIKTVHEQDDDTGEIIASDVLSYPMSVNVMPPQAEIDAYLAAEQTPDGTSARMQEAIAAHESDSLERAKALVASAAA